MLVRWNNRSIDPVYYIDDCRIFSLSELWLVSQFKASNGQLHFWTSHPIVVSKSYIQVGPVQVGLFTQAWKTLLLSWIWFPSVQQSFERENNGAKMMRIVGPNWYKRWRVFLSSIKILHKLSHTPPVRKLHTLS